MPNILITGAASGLGLEFLRVYAAKLNILHSQSSNNVNDSDGIKSKHHTPSTIYAIDRSPIALSSLSPSLAAAHPTSPTPHIRTFTLDITSPTAVSTLFNTALLDVPLDLVIHCAGIRGLVNSGHGVHAYSDVRDTESLDTMDADTMRRAWEVNVLGTFEVLRACVRGLRLAAAATSSSTSHRGAIPTTTAAAPIGEAGQPHSQPHSQTPTQTQIPKVIVMGSRMGSIAHNHASPTNPAAGGAYAYRASKAALNAVVRSLAVDVPEAIWTVVHPGRVETGLVRVKEDGAMGVQQSVGEMVALIERVGREESGRFVDRFGGVVPW